MKRDVSFSTPDVNFYAMVLRRNPIRGSYWVGVIEVTIFSGRGEYGINPPPKVAPNSRIGRMANSTRLLLTLLIYGVVDYKE